MAMGGGKVDIPFPFLLVAAAIAVVVGALVVQGLFDLDSWVYPAIVIAVVVAALLTAFGRQAARDDGPDR